MTETVELKPCPFCGGKDIDNKMHPDVVHCYRCGADGPAIPYAPDDKAWTWNTRSDPVVRDRVTDEMVEAAAHIVSPNCHWDTGYINAHVERRRENARSKARDALTAALCTSPPEPASGWSTHRHKKRGTEYVLIGIGKMQAENWFNRDTKIGFSSVDMREVAIYRSVDDGSLWARPREDFEDGRFEPLPIPQTKEPKQ